MKKTYRLCYHNYAYSGENEDTTPYHKSGWISVDNSTETNELRRLCPKPWQYQKPPGKTDVLPKWGRFSLYPRSGGYVAALGYKNKTAAAMIEMLRRHKWLDRQTRAIILEFSAFNPATNLLAVATYYYEIRSSGYKAPFNKITIITMYSNETGFFQFYLICILLFIIFALMFVGKICYSVYKQRWGFFVFFWNWIEIFQVLLSLLAVVMTIARSIKAVSTTKVIRKNIFENVNFQEVIGWKEADDGVSAILVFFSNLEAFKAHSLQ